MNYQITMERPEFLSDEILNLLENMQRQSSENMFDSISQLLNLYPDLSAFEAQQVLLYWQYASSPAIV